MGCVSMVRTAMAVHAGSSECLLGEFTRANVVGLLWEISVTCGSW